MKPFFILLILTLTLQTESFGQQSSNNYLELYIDPSASPINWESPGGLFKSYLKTMGQQMVSSAISSVFKSTVGHAVIRFHCTNTQGELQDFYTGLSGQEDDSEAKDLIINKKTGVLVLFKTFDDGYVEDSDESRNYIAHHFARTDTLNSGQQITKSPRFLRFQVNSHQCDQAIDVYQTFKNISFQTPPENPKNLPPEKKIYYGMDLDAYQMYLDHKMMLWEILKKYTT